MTPTAPDFLPLPDGNRLAFHRAPGRGPEVLFVHGFRSDMTGEKAVALERHCRERGLACIRFDCRGHGASSGRFEDLGDRRLGARTSSPSWTAWSTAPASWSARAWAAGWRCSRR